MNALATSYTVKIVPSDSPVGKLAEIELHFEGGLLDGTKLIGFAVWERRGGSGKNVTFPARQYSVNGERALLRPAGPDLEATHAVRDAILAAYADYEHTVDHANDPDAPTA